MSFERISLTIIRRVGKNTRTKCPGSVIGGRQVFLGGLLGLLMWTAVQAAGGLATAKPEEVGMSTERLARLDGVLEAAIENEETPGAAVLVGRRGRVVYRKAFGRRMEVPQQEAMTLETVFDVASMTKVMATATSILILVEEGKMSLSDRVSSYLPEFAKNGKETVTVLQLLTHFSGLRPDLDLDELWEGYETGIERALDEHLVAVPGTEFIYSDINYLVLAEIVRAVSGKRLDEFSYERVFKPLGLERTRFLPPPEWRSEIAPTEFREGEMIRGIVHDPTAFRMEGVAGHAGLFSTIDDTAVYAQMILNRGEYDGTRILSPLSVRRMTTPQSPSGMENLRGLGFDIDTPFSGSRGDLFPSGSFGHTGFTGTSLWIDPYTEMFVIVFTNRIHPDGEGNVVPLRKRIASVAAAAVLDLSEADRN